MRQKYLYFLLQNTSFGAFVGMLLGIGFMVFMDRRLEEEHIRYGTYLLTALTTMGASALALAGTLVAVDINRQNEEERRRAKLAAARAVLPLALSELSAICLTAVESIYDGTEARRQSIQRLTETSALLETLKENVEYGGPEIREALSDIVRVFQILTSRFRKDIFFDTTGNTAESVVSWAELYSMVAACFEYSRRWSNDVDRDLASGIDSFFDSHEFVESLTLEQKSALLDARKAQRDALPLGHRFPPLGS
ncbi:hypothetical protein [Mesobacterium pallidum]|uniref:hypothetical protein n=1 Tax=Mesobacterium pallidum TaxID=2872037 RepID=UPI001EE32BB6|nr:hypothetical protein [Mesobacterium pallidum]